MISGYFQSFFLVFIFFLGVSEYSFKVNLGFPLFRAFPCLGFLFCFYCFSRVFF